MHSLPGSCQTNRSRVDRKLTRLERAEPDSFQPTERRISAVKHTLLTRAGSLFTAESVSLTFTEKFSASRSAGLAAYLTTWCGNSSKAISLKPDKKKKKIISLYI